jgi:hypothetical protein
VQLDEEEVRSSTIGWGHLHNKRLQFCQLHFYSPSVLLLSMYLERPNIF